MAKKPPPNSFGKTLNLQENGPTAVVGIEDVKDCRRQQYQRTLSYNIVVGMPIIIDDSEVELRQKLPEKMSLGSVSLTKNESRRSSRSENERSITHLLVNRDATKSRIMREYRELRMALKPSTMIPPPPRTEEESKLSSPYQALLKQLQAAPREDYHRS